MPTTSDVVTYLGRYLSVLAVTIRGPSTATLDCLVPHTVAVRVAVETDDLLNAGCDQESSQRARAKASCRAGHDTVLGLPLRLGLVVHSRWERLGTELHRF